MPRLPDRCAEILILAFFRLFSRVPKAIIDRAAVAVGRFWFAVDRRHRDIALDNMRHALGDTLTEHERKALCRSTFINLARVALEIPFLLRLEKKNVHDHVVFEGGEHVQKALASGRGAVFLSAHMGNWELSSLAVSHAFEIPVTVVVRPLDYQPMDRVLTRLRSGAGNRVLDKDKNATEVGRLLQKGGVVGILMDQNASWYEGVFVPFFGRIACTNKGLAVFAKRYDPVILPVFNHRLPDGRYRAVFEPPLRLCDTGDVGKDIIENTALFNRVIEENIRKAPDAWLWVHRRWRIKPVPRRARNRLKGAPGFNPDDFLE